MYTQKIPLKWFVPEVKTKHVKNATKNKSKSIVFINTLILIEWNFVIYLFNFNKCTFSDKNSNIMFNISFN